MVIHTPNKIYDVIFAIEDTANHGAFFKEIKNSYISSCLSYFNESQITDHDFGSLSNSSIYGLVTYKGNENGTSEPLVQIHPPTHHANTFSMNLSQILFRGGRGGDRAHVTEAIAASLDYFDNISSLRTANMSVEKHLILCCCSPGYQTTSKESCNYSNKIIEELMIILKEKGIYFSLFSPRKLSSLKNIYTMINNGSEALSKNYCQDSRHLILPSKISLPEYSLSPSTKIAEDPINLPSSKLLTPKAVCNPIMQSQQSGNNQMKETIIQVNKIGPNQQHNLASLNSTNPMKRLNTNQMPQNYPNLGHQAQLQKGVHHQQQQLQQQLQQQQQQQLQHNQLIMNQQSIQPQQMNIQQQNMTPNMQMQQNMTSSQQQQQQQTFQQFYPQQQQQPPPPQPQTSQMPLQNMQPQQSQLHQLQQLQQQQMQNQQLQNISQQQQQLKQADIQQQMMNPPHPLPNQTQPQKVIWKGTLDWVDKLKMPPNKLQRLTSCHILINQNEPHINTTKWPPKLQMSMFPPLINQPLQPYLRNSRTVYFSFPQNNDPEAMSSLFKYLSGNFSGCIHFPLTNQSEDFGEIRVLILLYSSKKQQYIGLIPIDQTKMLTTIKAVINKHRAEMSQKMQQAGDGQGTSQSMNPQQQQQQQPQQLQQKQLQQPQQQQIQQPQQPPQTIQQVNQQVPFQPINDPRQYIAIQQQHFQQQQIQRMHNPQMHSNNQPLRYLLMNQRAPHSLMRPRGVVPQQQPTQLPQQSQNTFQNQDDLI